MKIKKLKFKQFISSPWFWFILLCLLTVLAYSNTFHVPFIFDDVDNIARNPSIQFEKLDWENFQKLKYSLNWKRPVSLFTFGMNYYFDRFNVVGYHIVNLLIHLLNGLLLFVIMKKTLSFSSSLRSLNANISAKPWRDTLAVSGSKTAASALSPLKIDGPGGATVIPLFATALWLLNPTQIFSVTYVVQRMNSLSAMFSLLCLLFYIKSRRPILAETQSSRRVNTDIFDCGNSKNNKPQRSLLLCERIFFAFISLVFALLAIGSKQNAILLPLFILLYEFYFIQDLRFQWIKQCWKHKWVTFSGIFVVVLLICGLGYIVYFNTAANPWKHILFLYKGRDFTLIERMLTQPRIVVYYLSLVFYPNPSRMALLVDITKSTGLLQPISTLLSIFFLCGLLLTALISAKRYRLFSFAILWFFIGQLLESTIIPLELVYIHRNYLPTMFIYLPLVVWLFGSLRRLGANNKINLTSLPFLINIGKRFGVKRLFALGDRKLLNNTDLPTHCHNDSLSSRCAFVVLTAILLLFSYWTYSYNNILNDRKVFWEDNINKFPELARPHANLAVALVDRGEYAKAHAQYQIALKIKPNDIKNLFNVGVVYEKEGKLIEAVRYYSKALKINRKFADAWCNQGNCLIELGDFDNGLSCLYAAWKLNKFDPVINYNLALALMQKKNMKGVLFHLHRAIKSDPNYVDAYVNLGITYFILKNYNAAKKYFSKALELKPNMELAENYILLLDAIEQNKLPAGAVEVGELKPESGGREPARQ